jgi:tripartite ATP-independent transporter DctP family solute receptor
VLKIFSIGCPGPPLGRAFKSGGDPADGFTARFSASIAAPNPAAAPTMTETARFTYRLGSNQPADSTTARRLAAMAAAIRTESDGRLVIAVFPESRLGPDPQMLAALRAGALEFYLAGATLGALAPSSVLPLMPFAFATAKAVFAALDGALGERIRGELAQSGLHAFRHCWQNGFHHLTTRARPIRTAADLRGLKMRSPGGAIAADFFRTLGAEAGMVPFSGLYDALKAGHFDGQSDPLGVVLSLRLYEVQGCLALTGHWWSGFTLLAHKAAWDALPRDLQDIVARNAEKFALLQRADSERVNAAAAAELARRGMRIEQAEIASFRDGLGDFYRRWRERAGAAAWRLLEIYADALAA